MKGAISKVKTLALTSTGTMMLKQFTAGRDCGIAVANAANKRNRVCGKYIIESLKEENYSVCGILKGASRLLYNGDVKFLNILIISIASLNQIPGLTPPVVVTNTSRHERWPPGNMPKADYGQCSIQLGVVSPLVECGVSKSLSNTTAPTSVVHLIVCLPLHRDNT